MHNKDAIGTRTARSLWHQSITALRQGITPVETAARPSGHSANASAAETQHLGAAGARPLLGADASSDPGSRARNAGDDLCQSLGAVATVSSVLRRMDAQTHNHSERVARNALRLAQRVGVASENFPALQLGALLHDCGKIGVDADILNKPAALTREEFDEIKKHPMFGVAILDSVPLLRAALPIVRHHHERFDGRGYPDGLRGEEIPLLARIVAIADAFDAMISDRPYRRGMSPKDARGILCLNGGAQFDPDLVDAFVTDDDLST